MPQLAAAVEYARGVGATSADAGRRILEHRRGQPVGLSRLDGHLHLKAVRVQAADPAAYRALAPGVPPGRGRRPRAWRC